MTRCLARTDAIMLNIAIAQAKMIDMVSECDKELEFDFYKTEDGEFHDFEITNRSTGARLIFQCPMHPLYFNKLEDSDAQS